MTFRDRLEAGKVLAETLRQYAHRADVLVAALPRGGVPVAGVVADALGAPLDIVLVRKLGMPFDQELGFGAIAEGGVRFIDERLTSEFRVGPKAVEEIVARQEKEIERRASLYRGSKPAQPIEGKTVLVIDDGLATGATMFAAVRALRQRGAARVIVAVPVGPRDTVAKLQREADDVICLHTPDYFFAVGAWYADFEQVSDDEVRAELAARGKAPAEAQ